MDELPEKFWKNADEIFAKAESVANLPAIPASSFGIAKDITSEGHSSGKNGNVEWFSDSLMSEPQAEPKADNLPGKPGSIERLAYLTEYYAKEEQVNGPHSENGSGKQREHGDTPFDDSKIVENLVAAAASMNKEGLSVLQSAIAYDRQARRTSED